MVVPSQVLAQGMPLLPAPGTMISTSSVFQPVTLRGITIFPENPLQFDFIVDIGDTQLNDSALKSETEKLIRYFMAALTLPEEDLWVNLSPYEGKKIVADKLGVTELGRDLLAQDYILKQLTASLLHPDQKTGKEFWNRVYKKAQEKFGTTEVPINTFNKVWIVPERAVVFESKGTALSLDSHLKVMLEEDYLALRSQKPEARGLKLDQKDPTSDIGHLTSNIVRDIIIPELEKEVNEGENFAPLRQIYNSVILAAWFKENLKQSLLGQVYADKGKIAGINTEDKSTKQEIYNRYLEAYKKGAYNFLKEEYDQASQQMVPRQYFSGGVVLPLHGAAPAGATQLGVQLMAGSLQTVTSNPAALPPQAEAKYDSLAADSSGLRRVRATMDEPGQQALGFSSGTTDSDAGIAVRQGFKKPEGQKGNMATHSLASYRISDLFKRGVKQIPDSVVQAVQAKLKTDVKEGRLKGAVVQDFGANDVDILVTHQWGDNNASVHRLMLEALREGLVEAKKLGLLDTAQFSTDVKFVPLSEIRQKLAIQATDHTIAIRGKEGVSSESIGIAKGIGVGPSAANIKLLHLFAILGSGPGQKLAHTRTPGFRFRIKKIDDILAGKKDAKDWELEISMARTTSAGEILKSVYEGIQALTLGGQPSDYLITAVYPVEGGALDPVEPLATVLYSPVGGKKGRSDNLNTTIIFRLQSGAEAVGGVGTLVETVHTVPGGPTGENFVATMPVSLKEARKAPPEGLGYFAYWGYQAGVNGEVPPTPGISDHVGMNPDALKPERRVARFIGRVLRDHGKHQPYVAPWAARHRAEPLREKQEDLFVHAPKENENDPIMASVEDRIENGDLIAVTDDKADTGGTWGHTKVPLPFTALYKATMLEAVENGELGDGNSFGDLGFNRIPGDANIGIGDDGHMIKIGDKSRNSIAGHKTAFRAFIRAYLLAKENPETIGVYGLAQDLAGPEAALALQNPFTFSEFTPRFFEIARQIMPKEYMEKGVLDRLEEKWKRWQRGEVKETPVEGGFSGNVSGQGAGSARVTLDPKQEDSFTIIAGDKMGPAAFNPVIDQALDAAINSGDFQKGLVLEIWDAKAWDKEGKLAIKDIPKFDDIKSNFNLPEEVIKKLKPKTQEAYKVAKVLVEASYGADGQVKSGLSELELKTLADAIKRFGYVPTKRIFLDAQADREEIGRYLADSDRFNVKYIWSKTKAGWDVNNPTEYLDRPIMGSSVTKLGVLTGGEYIGKDDPVMVGISKLMVHMKEVLRTNPPIVQGDMFGSHWPRAVVVALKYAAANVVSHPIISILSYGIKVDEDGKAKFTKVSDIGGGKDFAKKRAETYEFNREFRFSAIGGEVEPYGTHKDTVEASYGLAKHLDELNQDTSPFLLANKMIQAEKDGVKRSWPQLSGDAMEDVYAVAVRDISSLGGGIEPTGSQIRTEDSGTTESDTGLSSAVIAQRTAEMSQNVLFGGNWKERKDITNEDQALAKAREFKTRFAQLPAGAKVIIFPEAKWVQAVARELQGSNIQVGVQSVFFDPDGDLQAQIDKAVGMGATYANVAHSMHRARGLTNEQANKIMLAILKDGRLMPWYTVEETGKPGVDPVQEITSAIEIGLQGISADVIASFPTTLEPTVLISTQSGTGVIDPNLKPSKEDAEKRSRAVRELFRARYGNAVADGSNVGYGASVKSSNAEDIFSPSVVRNALIGGASLEAGEFFNLVANGMKSARLHPPVSASGTTDSDTGIELPADQQPEYGGIDITKINAKLQIQRDRTGAPLPMNLQPLDKINTNLKGLVPNVRYIGPMTVPLPMLLGVADQIPKQELSSAR